MSTYEEFRRIVCGHASYFYLMLVGVTIMAALNLAAVLVGDQSEGAFVVSVLVFVILGVTGAGLAILLLWCKRR